MNEKNSYLDIYERFLGKESVIIKKNHRCKVCHKTFVSDSKEDRLCKTCDNYEIYLFLNNLKKETFL
jgi:DnaJ-class molecular chaperone